MGLCVYKNMFGEPNKGVHSIRVAGLAAVDVGMTVAAAAAIAYAFKRDFAITTVALFVLAIILHRLFCVDTVINRAIFGRVA
jgi:hypothetical protein